VQKGSYSLNSPRTTWTLQQSFLRNVRSMRGIFFGKKKKTKGSVFQPVWSYSILFFCPRLSFMTHVKFVIYRENKVHHTPSTIKLRLSNNLGLNPACTAADNRIWLQIKKVLNSVQGGVGKRERVNWKGWWDVLVKT